MASERNGILPHVYFLIDGPSVDTRSIAEDIFGPITGSWSEIIARGSSSESDRDRSGGDGGAVGGFE